MINCSYYVARNSSRKIYYCPIVLFIVLPKCGLRTQYLSQYLTNLMHKICFTISFISCLYMFRAHVLETYYKTRFCASSWLITKIILRCTVSKTSKFVHSIYPDKVNFQVISIFPNLVQKSICSAWVRLESNPIVN